MRIPYSWLAECVSVPWTPQELGSRLTMAGLELEGLKRAVQALLQGSPKSDQILGLQLAAIAERGGDVVPQHERLPSASRKTSVCGAPGLRRNPGMSTA